MKKQGERYMLDVTGKRAKARVIPISERLASILDDWREFCEAQPAERVVRGLAAGGLLGDGPDQRPGV